MANNTAWAIDRVRRVVGFGSDSSAFLNLTQLEGVTIKATTDKTEVVDALGSPIMELMRAKKVQIDGNSSLFDLNLLGAQMGSKVEVSSAENKFMVPCFETYTYSAGNGGTYALKHTIPTGKLGSGIQKYAYKINKDGSIEKKYEFNATASEDKFGMATTTNTTTFTPPTGVAEGDRFLIMYEYEADATASASRVVDKAELDAMSGRFMLEVLFRSLCDKNQVAYGFVVCENAQLDGNVDVSLAPDGKHPFSISAMPAYCDENKQLFSFIIPDAEAVA